MQVAESKGLPQLKYHLLPRTKGFTTTLHCLKGTGRRTLLTAPGARPCRLLRDVPLFYSESRV